MLCGENEGKHLLLRVFYFDFHLKTLFSKTEKTKHRKQVLQHIFKNIYRKKKINHS